MRLPGRMKYGGGGTQTYIPIVQESEAGGLGEELRFSVDVIMILSENKQRMNKNNTAPKPTYKQIKRYCIAVYKWHSKFFPI